MTDVQSLAQRIQVYVTSQDRAISDLAQVVQQICEAVSELQRKYDELVSVAERTFLPGRSRWLGVGYQAAGT